MTQVSFLKDQPLFGVEVLFSAFSAFSAVEVLAADELSLLAELGLRLPITAGQFYGVWQHFYDDNFSGTDFTTHYVVLGFRFRVAEEELLLPDEQHDDYRWLTPDALLASDNVHANSRAYFLAEKRAGVPGL